MSTMTSSTKIIFGLVCFLIITVYMESCGLKSNFNVQSTLSSQCAQKGITTGLVGVDFPALFKRARIRKLSAPTSGSETSTAAEPKTKTAREVSAALERIEGAEKVKARMRKTRLNRESRRALMKSAREAPPDAPMRWQNEGAAKEKNITASQFLERVRTKRKEAHERWKETGDVDDKRKQMRARYHDPEKREKMLTQQKARYHRIREEQKTNPALAEAAEAARIADLARRRNLYKLKKQGLFVSKRQKHTEVLEHTEQRGRKVGARKSVPTRHDGDGGRRSELTMGTEQTAGRTSTEKQGPRAASSLSLARSPVDSVVKERHIKPKRDA